MNSKFWYFDGTTTDNYIDTMKQLHRVNGPAGIWCDGYEEWRQYDKLHRTNGPAIIKPDGSWQWFIDGKCTCYSGPARCDMGSGKPNYHWCIEDEWLTKEQFDVHPKNIEYQMMQLIEDYLDDATKTK